MPVENGINIHAIWGCVCVIDDCKVLRPTKFFSISTCLLEVAVNIYRLLSFPASTHSLPYQPYMTVGKIESPSTPASEDAEVLGEGDAARGENYQEEKAEKTSTLPKEVFWEEKHVCFIRGLVKKTDSFEHVVMEHLKVYPVNGRTPLYKSFYLSAKLTICSPSLPVPPSSSPSLLPLHPHYPLFLVFSLLPSADVRRVLGPDGDGVDGS